MHVRFGEFTLDTETVRLRHGEAERHLYPKAFELLRLLLEHRPRVLSKGELHDRLWPSTFVSEATLMSLVAEVRAALGETAGDARFVRTVHRLGYAFNGAAEDVGPRATRSAARARCWIVWEFGQMLIDGEHLLGRDVDVAVWLESPTISRHHARISVDGATATLEDLASKNGTYVRGARIAGPSALSDGDEIRLGSVALRFRLLETGRSTETQDPA
jgi:DNA-binding winged helix-turn-helix (wHTH) protein